MTCYGDYYGHPPPKSGTCSNQSGDIRKCYYCDKWFDSTETVMEHTKSHTTDPPYKCFCHLMFDTRPEREAHMDIVHYKITPASITTSRDVTTAKPRDTHPAAPVTSESEQESDSTYFSHGLKSVTAVRPLQIVVEKIDLACVVESRKVKNKDHWRKKSVTWKKCKKKHCETYVRQHDTKSICSYCFLDPVSPKKKHASPIRKPEPVSFQQSRYKSKAFISSSDSSSDDDPVQIPHIPSSDSDDSIIHPPKKSRTPILESIALDMSSGGEMVYKNVMSLWRTNFLPFYLPSNIFNCHAKY